MNIYDIAKKAGVSTATVSRHLNGSGYVGKKTAEKLEAIINESHYLPSAAAKSLSTGVSFKLIGLVCYDVCDLYYAKAVSTLEKTLKQSGYEIILSCTGKSIDNKKLSIETLISKNVDAIIFIGSVFMIESGKLIKDAAKIVPCFIINALIEGDNIYSSYCDDESAVYDAAVLMLKSGVKNPLYICDVVTYGSEKKLNGFLAAVKNGKTFQVPEAFDEMQEALTPIFKEHSPDGIICSNDVVAAAILGFAKLNKISVPNDLKVIGHNNSLIAKCTSPAITSIDNGVESLSKITAENIIQFFSGGKIKKSVKVGYKLIRRESF